MDLQIRPRLGLCIATLCCILILCTPASAQTAGTNVNMVSGTEWPGGDPFLQRQNEPSIAVSSRNPFHLLAGANDYRSVDLALTTNGETGDAWLGLFKSLDGGATWRSVLLPGCPYNTPICAGASNVKNAGYAAAADPTVRAGTNGMFYYAGLVFNRGDNPKSAIIVSRLIDLNNKENADPNDILNGDSIQYVSTSIVAEGSSSSFLDKPTMAVDVPRSGASTCNLTVNQPGNGAVRQSFEAGNVYVTYTAFAEQPDTNPTEPEGAEKSKLYFVRSTNCGATWSKPISINDDIVVNQGTSIAIDPKTGIVYIAWREFQYQSGSINQPDAIVVISSSDGGRTFCRPQRISTFTPFDEGTTNTSFRTNAYPTAAVDREGRVYVAYSARNTVPSGDARIVLASSLGGSSWTKPYPIDNPAIDPLTNPSGRGHQIMPALAFAGGKLTLLYYDLRLDHTYGLYTPLFDLSEPTGLYSEFPEFAGELTLNPPDFSAVFNQYIDDSTITLRRHTFDLRLAQALPAGNPVFAPSILVSQYSYGCCAANQTDIQQMEFNAPNLPLFMSGTVPFMGDYVDLAPGPFILPPRTKHDRDELHADWDNGDDREGWHFNLSPRTPTIFHAAWTDNRDVQPPPDGDWTQYTPPLSPSLGTTSIFQPGTSVPACQPGYTGTRNQNIYTAPISGGLIFGAPSNAKTLGNTVFNGQTVPFQRAFVVVAQNTTEAIKSFRLTIADQPAGGNASFLQFSPLTTLDLSIPPLSSASRPVFVVSTDPTASVTVDIAEITAPQGTLVPNGLTGNTTLNPDITNPGITNPSITNPGITNPGITNFEVTNPGITNPDITNPNITNPGITNPGITNPGITNSTFQNETVVNPSVTNPGITNPGITNASIANPGITNPGITNVNPANVSISDTQWTIVNNGNTEGAYTLNLASSSPVPPANVLQLIISKLYQTPAAPTGQSCNLAVETHNVIVTNIVNPVLLSPTNPGITNPGITNPGITNATVALAPGETANIIIRVVNTDIQNEPTFNPATSVVPVAVSQSVNTQTALSTPAGGTPPPPPISVPPLIITTTSLPDGVSNVVYAASITTQGGNPTSHTFSITAGALPAGLTLNATTGSITGVPTTPGATTFTVQAQDVGSALFPQNTATQQLSIRIAAPLVITTPPVLAPATPGAPYSQTVTTTGGVGPFTFSISSGTLPAGLTLSGGVISGTPTGAGTSSFTIRITDSSNPPQVTTQSFTITVGGVTQTAAAVTFVTEPLNTVGGQVLSGSPVTVQVTDSTGAPIPNANVVMNFNATPPCIAAALSGTLSQTTITSGAASFPDLSVNFGQHGFTLLASSGNATALSTAFNIEGYCDTGSMNAGRHNHGAIALPNGKVLVAGGAVNPDSSGALASAELYDPVARTFTTINSMNVARVDFTMTLLPNGTVLITGGFNDTAILSSAEIFDPATNTFTLLPNAMTSPRSEHTATLLANGKVLITGGNASGTVTLASAELFDPAANTFTATSHPMNVIRQIQNAVLLVNGNVLISGGFDTNGNPLATAELYNPVADTFTLTGNMNVARGNNAATLLYTGEVLVAGGLAVVDGAVARTTSAELYNPSTGTWSVTGSMNLPRAHYTGPVLTDGTVFIPSSDALPAGTNADIYDPSTSTFRLTANFTTEQAGFHEAVLFDGTVLLASGVNAASAVVPNSEIFYPLGLPASITITTTTVGNATQNAPYTQLLLERGGVGPLTWTLASGALPPGVTLSTSGILSGAPTSSGAFTFTAQVTDSATPNKSATSGPLNLVVAATSTPLAFPAQTLNTAIANAAYSSSLTVTGGATPYNFAITSGTFPPGVALASNGQFSGTPTVAGTSAFTVTVTDSSVPPQTASQSLAIVVLNLLTITTKALPTSISGTGYSDALVASGGTPPYTFAQTSGTLPAGITLGSTGLLTGSTTASGTFTFGVTVTDSSAPPQTASQTLMLVVVPPLAITTTTLPNGTAGIPYSATIVTTGGQGTVSQTVTSGALPTALSLSTSGTLSGTPSGAGIFTFTITATDQTVPPQVASQFYSITIAPQVQVAASVSFINSPQNSIGGQLLGGSPVSVQVTDSSGVAVPGVNVAMGFSGAPCSAAVLGGTLTQTTNASGVATFPDLTIDRGQRGFTLAATAVTAGGVSLPFNVEGFCQTATPSSSRFAATATSLPNALVLLTGGITSGSPTSVVATAELYDPVAHTFTPTGSMHAARAYHTATLLADGTVLITGGSATTINGASFQLGPASNTAEIYNPATGLFTQVTATMNSARALHSAVQLPGGTVLIAGGSTGSLNLSSAEIYDPVAQTFTASATGMTAAREALTATLLNNGQVLLAGGYGATGPVNQSAEIYDPVAKTFTATPQMAFPHGQHTGTLLPNGQVVLEGGDNTSFTATNSIEVYDPVAGTFTASAATLNTARTTQSASLLPDGRVLVEGGFDPTGTILNSAETFNDVTPADTLTGAMQTPRWYTTSTPLPDGTVLVAGGGFNAGTLTTLPVEIFYPATTTPISITTILPLAFANEPYTQQLQEQGGIGNLTWTLASGALPAGINLSSSGLLSGTATASSVSNFTVQVTDSSTPPRSGAQSYVLEVVPPLLTSPTLPTANPGVPYSQPITVLTGTAPYTFSLFGGSLPSGLTLASIGTVSGTTNVAPGNFTFVVKITDSSTPPISDTQTILISVAPPLVITTTSLPNGTLAVPYASTTITTTGGLPPIFFLLSSGSLPPGLALSQTGTLSGTPSSPGSFTFAVTAVSAASSGQLSPPQSYTVGIGTGTGLAVAPLTLAAPVLGTPYNQAFTISGGSPPYAVSLSGTLPGGLTFSGTSNPPAITGTPSVVGTFAGLTLTVTDSEIPPAQIQATYSLTVNGFSAACGTGSESLMDGSYAILMQGFDANGPRTLIGSVVFGGNGTIPAGQVDIGTDVPAGGGAAQNLVIVGAQSSYTVGPDQRGCLILTTSAGSSAYRFALSAVSNGLAASGHIIDFQQNGSYGSGFLRYQDPVAIANLNLSGSYAFEFTTPSSLATVGHWAMLGSFSALTGAVTGNSWDFNDTHSLDSGTTWPATGLAFPASETYAFDGSGSSRGTIQLPSVQQYSANQTLASANFVTYTVGANLMFVAAIPDANNKPLVGEIQEQVSPFNSLALNGSGYVDGVTTVPVAGAWVGSFSASANNWILSLDNDFGGTYTTGSSNGTYSVDSAGRTPLAFVGSTSPGPMLRVIGPNKAFFMLADGAASVGFVSAFSGGALPASVAGTYAFGATQGSEDRNVTNLTGIATFDALGNVTFTQDEATDNTATLISAAVLPNTYSYNATTGRGVIPATGTPHYVFYAATTGTIYLLDVTSVNPAVQELVIIGAPAAIALTPNPLAITAPTPGTMTATIPTLAGTGGQVINLASSNASIASVPATVTIPASANSASFQVTPGASSGSAVVSASASGLVSGTASVNVALGNLTLTLPGPLLGVGRSFNATATLTGPAPAAGVAVTLASSDTTIATVSPASITIPQGGTTATFTLNGVATGTVILTTSAPGFQNASPASLTVTNSLISLQSGTVTVAPGQSGSLAVSLSSLAPTGGITINFTSGNTAIATVTSSVFVPQGQQVPAANPQITGVAIGSTVITASAAGFAPDTGNVQVTVSASFNTTTISIPATRTSSIVLNISAPAPQPNGITFGLSIDNTSFATVPASATIPAGQLSTTIPVTGVAQGSATLSATSAGITTTTAAINVGAAPTMNVNITANVGQNLQVDNQSVGLSAGAPANENLTLTSNSANVLLATTLAGPFSQSITLPLAINSASVPTYSVQSLASSGTAQITAQATGYGNAVATVTLTPSGIEWVSGNLTTTTFTPNSTLTLAAYQLNPTTLAAQTSQNIRTGSTVSIAVTSSNTAFGMIVTSPVTMNPDTNTTTVLFQPVAPGTTNLVITTPTGFSTPTGTGATSISATVNLPNLTINLQTNLGQNLQVDGESIGLGAAPLSNETLTLTSNSANLLIANTAAGPFSQSITLALSQGSFSVPSFSVQSLASSGTAQLTAAAPGYNNGTATINLTPSGIEWLNGNFNTTTFSANNTLTMASYQLSPTTLAAQTSQNIRTGATVSITVTSSDSTIGTIVTSPVTMNADINTTTVLFHPVGSGTANLVIATPTGFTTPTGAGSTSIAATVSAPNLSVNVQANLGQNLQVDGESISLGAAPPSNETLTLTSNSPNLLIANTAAGPFSQSITLALSQGSFSVPSFSMQGLTSTGTAQLTASAPGYTNGTATITLTPSGIEWLNGNFNTTTFSANNTLTVASYQLNPTTLTAANSQNIRTGSTVSITVTSSAPTVGTILNSPVTINAGTNTATVGFHPLTAGTTNLVIATPTGFTTPTGNGSNSITATVTAPTLSINVQANLGQNLQLDGESISLGAAPPNNATLTLSSSSATVLLATTAAGPFSQSITLALSQGSFSVPGFSVQGLAATGSAQLTAQAPGYSDATATITLTPSAIEWLSGNFSTTTFTPNTTLTMAAYQLNPSTLTAQNSQNVRTGLPVSVTVTSSNTAFGAIVTSPVTLNADTNTTTISFQPVASGTTNLIIATPSGFTTPNGAGSNSITATVTAPNLSINVQTNIGQNLQVDGESIGLGAAPQTSETLTLSSNSSSLLIAMSAAGPFSQSITLPLVAGSFSVPGFSIQSLASTGTAQLTATANGYNNGTITINLTPSAIEWASGGFSTTTFTPNTTVTLVSYQLNPATLTAQNTQNLRTGLSVSVTVTTSDTTIGTIVNSPATLNPDTNATTVSFHPVGAGAANLLIATPVGFTTPNGAGSSSITATVTAPSLNINVSTNLGQNLQVDGESISLGAAPPSSETLTLSSNSASLLLATTPAGPFSQSITLPLTAGSPSAPAFSEQGLATSGSAVLTASAPGYNTGSTTVTLTPSAIEWNSGNFSTTTFSSNNSLSIASFQLNPATLTAQSSQNIRTGMSVSVSVTSSDTTIGTIVSSPVTINPDTNLTSVLFQPVAAGTAILAIATPTGFTTPNGAASSSITATVTAPNLSIGVVSDLGQNLQVDNESIGLAAVPPTSRTLTLTSGSAALLLATTPAGPFSQSITLPLTASSFTVPGFSIQALAGTGTALLTASAPGYSNGTATVTLTPSGIVWSSGSFSTTAGAADSNLTVIAAQLNATTLTAQAYQNIRTGAGVSVSVVITSSNTAAGTIIVSPVTINAGVDSASVDFHPVAAGVTNLIITTPNGFTTPNGSGATSIAATVN